MNNRTLRFNSSRLMLMFSSVLFVFLTALSISAANRNQVADFDGDGKTDISVYRRSDGYWYISKSSGGYLFIPWRAAYYNRLAPGDYDGDGKTDFAVEAQGSSYFNVWYILKSSDYTLLERNFGGHEYVYSSEPTVGADYDGDGKTDMVNIATRRSGGIDTYFELEIGLSSGVLYSGHIRLTDRDKVVSADYDGDGKADVATFRDGVWTIQKTTDPNGASITVAFGYSSDKPLPSDYDGDGKADIAVWRPSDGYWYWLSSRDGSFNSYKFGLSDDKPVPGDYDGDGKTDFAVFRPSSGIWYIQQSRDGFRAEQFGLSDDELIPSYFY